MPPLIVIFSASYVVHGTAAPRKAGVETVMLPDTTCVSPLAVNVSVTGFPLLAFVRYNPENIAVPLLAKTGCVPETLPALALTSTEVVEFVARFP